MLVGFGIDLIPNVDTWIPSIIIWCIAFIWAIISIIFWLRTRNTMKTDVFHFEFNDASVTTTPKVNILKLGVSYFASDKVNVETLQLEYNKKRFRPNNWHPVEIKHIHTENYDFDLGALRGIADESLQEASFIATVGGGGD